MEKCKHCGRDIYLTVDGEWKHQGTSFLSCVGPTSTKAEPAEPTGPVPCATDPSSVTAGDNMDLSKGGVKYDDGKARFDLIAPEFELGVAVVLAHGARKYRDRNWEKGMRWGRPIAALRRHLSAWMSGEETDPESGLHHLDHAACCLMFLRAYVARRIGKDDRKLAVE